ncbi:hypothetical protein R3I93_017496 [Phoxinus phoxinus]|uniref:Uncharacterized protein n=1 Tax=Phoxinus phoxinus TaxID=58324 RepID=A0AAN9CKF2_9TELE
MYSLFRYPQKRGNAPHCNCMMQTSPTFPYINRNDDLGGYGTEEHQLLNTDKF